MSEKIPENWKGIEDTEQEVREKTGDPDARFNAGTYWLGKSGRHLMISCKYRKKKGKKGQEEFTSSYYDMLVCAKFCPFTGKPLYTDSLQQSTP